MYRVSGILIAVTYVETGGMEAAKLNGQHLLDEFYLATAYYSRILDERPHDFWKHPDYAAVKRRLAEILNELKHRRQRSEES